MRGRGQLISIATVQGREGEASPAAGMERLGTPEKYS